jgi:hypothetical protein
MTANHEGRVTMPDPDWPALPLGAWRQTRDTLHLYLQIVGKIRLALSPPLNHWWHVTLYVSPRGLTTHAIPSGLGSFEIELDFIAHRLELRRSDGRRSGFSLHDGLAVRDFHAQLFERLRDMGIDAPIRPVPYDCFSDIPFPEDREHRSYDREYITRFHRVLGALEGIFAAFRGRFLGKSTPVHLFWHTFDLVVSRFSGRTAPKVDTMSAMLQEAYSHEVISFGFWSGDDELGAPAFYSYTYPEPAGLRDQPLQPGEAFWKPRNGSSLALYRYDDMRSAADPRAALLEFFGSAYLAGATAARWDVKALEKRW